MASLGTEEADWFSAPKSPINRLAVLGIENKQLTIRRKPVVGKEAAIRVREASLSQSGIDDQTRMTKWKEERLEVKPKRFSSRGHLKWRK